MAGIVSPCMVLASSMREKLSAYTGTIREPTHSGRAMRSKVFPERAPSIFPYSRGANPKGAIVSVNSRLTCWFETRKYSCIEGNRGCGP